MMRVSPLAFVASTIFLAAVAHGQNPAPTPPPTDLEDLRDWARGRLESQEGAFKDMLAKSLPILGSSAGNDTPVVRETIGKLAERAAVFPTIVLDRLLSEKNETVRARLGDVLAATGDPSITPMLLSRAATSDEAVAASLVNVLGRLRSHEVAPALEATLATEKRLLVVAELIRALARCESKDALATARANLAHVDTKVRQAAIDALGLVGQGREDVESLRKLAAGSDPALRDAALRSLGRFKGDFDALKTLHDAVNTSDSAAVGAALDGLETAGTKDLSPKFILQAVKSGPADQRERAARLLMRFNNPDGVKHLFAKERSDAEKNPEDRDLQMLVADRYREFGWYEGAVPFYDRALAARGGVGTQQVLVALARSYARLKRFDEARKKLKQAGYTTFRGFADDADFAEMREAQGFKDNFR